MAEIVNLAAVRRLSQNSTPVDNCNKPEPDYRQQFLDMFVPVGSLPKKRYARPDKKMIRSST
jgi:hypothetical protein